MVYVVLGILAIVAGIALIFISLGEILLRISVAIFGLWLINYGWRYRGKDSLCARAHSWYWYRKF